MTKFIAGSKVEEEKAALPIIIFGRRLSGPIPKRRHKHRVLPIIVKLSY